MEIVVLVAVAVALFLMAVVGTALMKALGQANARDAKDDSFMHFTK